MFECGGLSAVKRVGSTYHLLLLLFSCLFIFVFSVGSKKKLIWTRFLICKVVKNYIFDLFFFLVYFEIDQLLCILIVSYIFMAVGAIGSIFLFGFDGFRESALQLPFAL